MKISSSSKSTYQYCIASVPDVYSNIKVIVGSEEMIYDKKYVTAIVNNNRLVKFLKESVKFK
jgi:hypothetical protein